MRHEAASHIEAVRVGKLPGVAIRGCHQQVHQLTLADAHACKVKLLDGPAEERGNDAGVAEQFLDGAGHQCRRIAEARPLGRMTQQGGPGIRQQPGEGLRNAYHRGFAHARDLRIENSLEFGGGLGGAPPHGRARLAGACEDFTRQARQAFAVGRVCSGHQDGQGETPGLCEFGKQVDRPVVGNCSTAVAASASICDCHGASRAGETASSISPRT